MGYRSFSVYTGRMMRNVCAIALLLVLQVPIAMAFQATQNLSVSVLVPNPVQVSATPMDFGSSVTGQAARQSTAVISVTMANTQAYNITLDAGLHLRTERRVSNGAGSFVSYTLYKNAARSQLWGDSGFAGSYINGSSLIATGTGVNQTFTIYATMQATSINLPAGTYNDSVLITINY